MEKKSNFSTAVPKKLKLSEYSMFDTLGTGSFGRVKLAKHKGSEKYYAIKIMKKQVIIKSKQVTHIMNEIRILSIMNHPFAVNGVFIIGENRRICTG
jgi:protein kinase A